jgi:hypothetical protein
VHEIRACIIIVIERSHYFHLSINKVDGQGERAMTCSIMRRWYGSRSRVGAACRQAWEASWDPSVLAAIKPPKGRFTLPLASTYMRMQLLNRPLECLERLLWTTHSYRTVPTRVDAGSERHAHHCVEMPMHEAAKLNCFATYYRGLFG